MRTRQCPCLPHFCACRRLPCLAYQPCPIGKVSLSRPAESQRASIPGRAAMGRLRSAGSAHGLRRCFTPPARPQGVPACILGTFLPTSSSLQRLHKCCWGTRRYSCVQQGVKSEYMQQAWHAGYRPPPLLPLADAPKSSATPAQISWQRCAYRDCTSATPRERRAKSAARSPRVRSSSWRR